MILKIKDFQVVLANDLLSESIYKLEKNSVFFYFIKSKESSKYFDLRIYLNSLEIHNEFIKTLIVNTSLFKHLAFVQRKQIHQFKLHR